ncbi:hypothetical protein JCM14469_26330 [Desulfatiferula olefinivorans]
MTIEYIMKELQKIPSALIESYNSLDTGENEFNISQTRTFSFMMFKACLQLVGKRFVDGQSFNVFERNRAVRRHDYISFNIGYL